MLGTIHATNLKGGTIQKDGGGVVGFRWVECRENVQPLTVGFGVRVQFYLDLSNGSDRAIDVRREN